MRVCRELSGGDSGMSVQFQLDTRQKISKNSRTSTREDLRSCASIRFMATRQARPRRQPGPTAGLTAARARARRQRRRPFTASRRSGRGGGRALPAPGRRSGSFARVCVSKTPRAFYIICKIKPDENSGETHGPVILFPQRRPPAPCPRGRGRRRRRTRGDVSRHWPRACVTPTRRSDLARALTARARRTPGAPAQCRKPLAESADPQTAAAHPGARRLGAASFLPACGVRPAPRARAPADGASGPVRPLRAARGAAPPPEPRDGSPAHPPPLPITHSSGAPDGPRQTDGALLFELLDAGGRGRRAPPSPSASASARTVRCPCLLLELCRLPERRAAWTTRP